MNDKERYRANRKAGLCGCGRGRAPGRKSCRDCLGAMHTTTDRQRNAGPGKLRFGNCKGCGADYPHGDECPFCGPVFKAEEDGDPLDLTELFG